MLQDLPPEIIIRIADEIPSDPEPPEPNSQSPVAQHLTLVCDRPESFTSLSVVCRSLRNTLIPYLFESMSFTLFRDTTLSRDDIFLAAAIALAGWQISDKLAFPTW
jgi:hypothetical protein